MKRKTKGITAKSLFLLIPLLMVFFAIEGMGLLFLINIIFDMSLNIYDPVKWAAILLIIVYTSWVIRVGGK